MSGGNRTGRVSSVDYEAGTYEVTYFDRGQSVTKKINALSNGEYKMPKIGQMVSVSHNANGAAAATAAGSIWNKTNRPVEGYAGLYRKEYGDTPGTAYERFDENTGEYSQYLGDSAGCMARISKGAISDDAEGTADYSAGGQLSLRSLGGAVSIQGKTGVGIVSEAGASVEAGTVISMEAGTDLSLVAGGDLTMKAGGKLVFQAGGNTIEIAADGSCTIGAGGGSVSVSAAGAVTLTGASGGSVAVSADGDVSISGAASINLSAPTITINGTTVSIAGNSGSAVIGGKSLTAHTHTDSYGGSTSGPN